MPQSSQPLYSQYLTEAMGLCFHETKTITHTHAEYIPWEEYVCTKCGAKDLATLNIDFSTGNGFILLWNWCVEQEWWHNFLNYSYWDCMESTSDWLKHLIHPKTFAETIYNFLKDNIK